jgi:hypothetical protein
MASEQVGIERQEEKEGDTYLTFLHLLAFIKCVGNSTHKNFLAECRSERSPFDLLMTEWWVTDQRKVRSKTDL